MSRRVITYLAVFMCAALVSLSGVPAGGNDEPVVVYDPLDRTPVLAVYADDANRKIIDSAANVILDESGSLVSFWEKLQRVRSGSGEVVSIVHIGDSHVQAGFWDARLRELMQADFGNAGRGLIVPHRLAGGNEPRDYSILTKEKYVSGRATSRDLAEKAGMTGVAIGMDAANPQLKIWSKEPFNSVTVFHHAKAPAFIQPDSLFIGSYCTLGNTGRTTRIDLLVEVDSIALEAIITPEYNNPTIYGFSLENGMPGVLIHSIGVNSAAFEHIEKNTDLTDGGARELIPDLIIVSLGTNNCFGNNYRSNSFRETAEGFIRKMRDSYPGTAILITTPMEACRRVRRTYPVNKNVSDVAEILVSVARENGVACWNLYGAAGGVNSTSVWYGRKLMQADRLHLTETGYALQGEMLYDAMMRSYNALVCPEMPIIGGPTEIESMHEGELYSEETDSAAVSLQNGALK